MMKRLHLFWYRDTEEIEAFFDRFSYYFCEAYTKDFLVTFEDFMLLVEVVELLREIE